MATRQKAIILTYHGPPFLTFLVDALEKYGYDVVLLLTGRGPNYALAPGAYQAMGDEISKIWETYDFPILAIKNITQGKKFILAAEADIALCLGFPYRITDDLLSSRTTFVNFHPAPLPVLRGPSPFHWPLLRPDLFPIKDYTATAQYMGSAIDSGRIIAAPKVVLADGIDESTMTATDVYNAALKTACDSADEVVRLVRSGYEGVEIAPLPLGYQEYGARKRTDEERTITSDMTVDEADRIWRARFGPQLPFFRSEYGLFQVTKFRKLNADSLDAIKAKKQASGSYRANTRVVQAVKDGVVELDVRKL